MTLIQEIENAKAAGLSLHEFRKERWAKRKPTPLEEFSETIEAAKSATAQPNINVPQSATTQPTSNIPVTGDKGFKHGFFTESAGWLALVIIAISIIVILMGLSNIDSRDGSAIGLITLGASGIVSAIMFGLLSEISMKLTTKS